MHRGRRAAAMPAAGRRRARRGIRHRRGRSALAPLTKTPFVLAAWSRCKVGPDIHVKVGQSMYSVPWKHIGQTLDARSTARMVQLFSRGNLVKTHVRKPRGRQTDLADYPPVMWNVSAAVKPAETVSVL